MSQSPPPPPYGSPEPGAPYVGHYPGVSPAQARGADGLTSEERTWGGAAHWSALVGSAFGLAFLGPLVVMLVGGDRSPWIRRQSVESLNFQLSMLLYATVGGVLAVVVAIVTLGLGVLLVLPAALALGVLWLVLTIIGSVRASGGVDYRYPLTIRFLS
ncbi:MAG: orotate phosphoribosyltransferase [Nocardioides sp.]|nr:orotate phosphoribosyltransferase [Nocardioides sp.]